MDRSRAASYPAPWAKLALSSQSHSAAPNEHQPHKPAVDPTPPSAQRLRSRAVAAVPSGPRPVAARTPKQQRQSELLQQFILKMKTGPTNADPNDHYAKALQLGQTLNMAAADWGLILQDLAEAHRTHNLASDHCSWIASALTHTMGGLDMTAQKKDTLLQQIATIAPGPARDLIEQAFRWSTTRYEAPRPVNSEPVANEPSPASRVVDAKPRPAALPTPTASPQPLEGDAASIQPLDPLELVRLGVTRVRRDGVQTPMENEQRQDLNQSEDVAALLRAGGQEHLALRFEQGFAAPEDRSFQALWPPSGHPTQAELGECTSQVRQRATEIFREALSEDQDDGSDDAAQVREALTLMDELETAFGVHAAQPSAPLVFNALKQGIQQAWLSATGSDSAAGENFWARVEEPR